MVDFAQAMASDPARLVVMFQRASDGSEQFQWGVVGSVPVLNLLAGIARAQGELLCGAPMGECGERALAMLWDAGKRAFVHYLHPDVPRDPLAGMLEAIKAAIVGGRTAQHNASQRVQLLGPDGRPANFGRPGIN